MIKIDTVSENNLLAYLNKQQINGRLEKIGETSLFSPKDQEGIKFSAAGNTLQFQSKYPFGKKHKDIFTSQGDDIEMNKFKTLSSPVNSTFDEHFVFYDETAPALYFTSQGHNSAGGYDIFRSYYDKPTNKWSKPENLGFPINTPFDEVAYVTVPGTQKSILVSRRNSGPGKLVVYFLDNADANAEETTLTPQAREIGHFTFGGNKNFTAFSKTKTTEKEK
ncbi:MAG: hypothetical protein HC831_31770, partial [Chloroflexia bacterium]|nr:hypothetical protein [Chloroflexia bacterium]